jgi:pimeloyl-ACP methyl ester carboxylesterase
LTTVTRQISDFARAGDVRLFVRRFGIPGANTPLLILHGANYYDSRDWVQIARELAANREVATYDSRGYGLSSWSPSQDYSLDAQLADISAVLDYLGWETAMLVGHSRGGSLSLRYAHTSSERVAGLVLVDFSPSHIPGRSGVGAEHVGPWGAVYASLKQAHAATSRNPRELETEAGRVRVESIFGQRDGGWVNVRRDPAFQNDRPNDRPGWTSALKPVDLWEVLAGLVGRRAPVLVVRGLRSPVYDEAALSRLRIDFPAVQVAEVDSGHDAPGESPGELVAAVKAFVD